jgi:hypothetical protein
MFYTFLKKPLLLCSFCLCCGSTFVSGSTPYNIEFLLYHDSPANKAEGFAGVVSLGINFFGLHYLYKKLPEILPDGLGERVQNCLSNKYVINFGIIMAGGYIFDIFSRMAFLRVVNNILNDRKAREQSTK